MAGNITKEEYVDRFVTIFTVVWSLFTLQEPTDSVFKDAKYLAERTWDKHAHAKSNDEVVTESMFAGSKC